MIVAAPPDPIIKDDEKLRRAVTARLPDVIELRGNLVHVAVTSGVVSLTGEVGSECARRAARVLAECVRGVQGIDDRHLVVRTGVTTAAPEF